MKKILLFFAHIISWIYQKTNVIISFYEKNLFAYHANDAVFLKSDTLSGPWKISLGKNSHIFGNSKILISSFGEEGKLIVKENVCIAQGLTVITGNHKRTVGKLIKDNMLQHITDINSDIIVDNDVWIGANVSLLPGIHIGRGANIGTGAVVRISVPPYAIVLGNPAKIVGFCFSPEEVIEHEKILYPENDRIPLAELEANYQKFFLKRLKEIKEFTKI